ncbi:MAG: hypothetical protein RLZ98_1119 [Pseudomonadota bacterium]|jgi:ribosome-associated heat shock protein Hsp15
MARKPDREDEVADAGTQRIDRWLWFIRAVKSRTLAAGLVGDGKVRINRVKIDKPSHAVKPGDVITLALRGKIRVIEVVAVGTRRGPASEAAGLFAELSPMAPARHEPEQLANVDSRGPATPQDEPPQRARGTGRPTKRERRHLDRLKRGNREI